MGRLPRRCREPVAIANARRNGKKTSRRNLPTVVGLCGGPEKGVVNIEKTHSFWAHKTCPTPTNSRKDCKRKEEGMDKNKPASKFKKGEHIMRRLRLKRCNPEATALLKTRGSLTRRQRCWGGDGKISPLVVKVVIPETTWIVTTSKTSTNHHGRRKQVAEKKRWGWRTIAKSGPILVAERGGGKGKSEVQKTLKGTQQSAQEDWTVWRGGGALRGGATPSGQNGQSVSQNHLTDSLHSATVVKRSQLKKS